MRIDEILDLTKLHSNPSQLNVSPEVRELVRVSNLETFEYIDQIIVPYARNILKDDTAIDIQNYGSDVSKVSSYLRSIFWHGAGYSSKISNKRFVKKLKVFHKNDNDQKRFVIFLLRFLVFGEVISILAVEGTDKWVEYTPTFILPVSAIEKLEAVIKQIGVASALRRRPKELKKW
jgi:hypothetical protein